MVLLVSLQWFFNPFSCLYVMLTLASICSSEQHSSAPSTKHFIYLSLNCSEGEAPLYSTFHGIYCALLDQNCYALFFFFKFFNQVIWKKFQQAKEREKRENRMAPLWNEDRPHPAKFSAHQAFALALEEAERVVVICAGKQEVSGVILL